jgi:starch synthase
VRAYANGPAWRETMLCGMAKDFSWKTSAAAYSALYRRLLERA